MLRIISGLLLLELSTFLLGLGSSIYLGYAQMVDAEGLVYEEDEEDGIVNEDLRVWCSRNRTWRSAGTLHKLLPNTMTITQYVKGLYWFSEGISDKNARKQSGLSVKAWRKLSTEIRLLMFQDIENLQRTLPRLGGPGCFVATDECYFTKRKQVKGGFQGRRTIGNKTCVLGMVEVDLQTRRATGNIRLLIIPGAKVPAIKRAITDHVVQGSLVFTDRHQSYQWMARPGSGYVHRCVNHRAREFHRVETIFGVQVNVTSNPAEGLFGRLKTFNREKEIKRLSRNHYGIMLTEFLWRQHYTGPRTEWYGAALWPVLDLIRRAQLDHPAFETYMDPLSAPLELDLEFQFWKADTANEHYQPPGAAAAPIAYVAPPAPNVAPAPPNTPLADPGVVPPRVVDPDDVLDLCNSEAADLQSDSADEGSSSDVTEASVDWMGNEKGCPCWEEERAKHKNAWLLQQASRDVKLEMKEEEEEDQVQVVSVRDAPVVVPTYSVGGSSSSRPSQPMVGKAVVTTEAAKRNLKAASADEPVRKRLVLDADLTLWCPQGHTLKTADPTPGGETKKTVYWYSAQCDVCKKKVKTKTWRCEVCDWDVCGPCFGGRTKSAARM